MCDTEEVGRPGRRRTRVTLEQDDPTSLGNFTQVSHERTQPGTRGRAAAAAGENRSEVGPGSTLHAKNPEGAVERRDALEHQ